MLREAVKKYGLVFVVGLGFLLRLLFVLFGAEKYFGKPDFQLMGDTFAWIDLAENLINHGHYAMVPDGTSGMFEKPPAYSFFYGLFYLITGKDQSLAIQLVSWSQLFLDTLSIYLFYKIVRNVFDRFSIALIAAFLYAVYPFVIVWVPVVYAEIFSIILVLGSLVLLTSKQHTTAKLLFGGLLLAAAVLARLQVIFLVPALFLYLWYISPNWKNIFNYTAYGISFAFLFLMWPIRNYLSYNKVLFTMESNSKCYQKDMYGFWEFITSVQEGFEPQFQEILNWQPITMPKNIIKEDSMAIAKVFTLAQQSGSSFWNFRNFSGRLTEKDSQFQEHNQAIFNEFHRLAQRQKQKNFVTAYINVPLANLKKAVFKSSKVSSSTSVIINMVFAYRTFLIIISFAALLFWRKMSKQEKGMLFFVFVAMLSWYLYICFFYRNLEMRYFLQNDILLLIPAAVVFDGILNKVLLRKKKDE